MRNDEILELPEKSELIPAELVKKIFTEPEPAALITAFIQHPAPVPERINAAACIYRKAKASIAVLEREIEERKNQIAEIEHKLEILRQAAEDIFRLNGMEGDRSVAGVTWRRYAGGWTLDDSFPHDKFREAYPHCYEKEVKYKPNIRAIKAKLMELAAAGAPPWEGSGNTAPKTKLYFESNL